MRPPRLLLPFIAVTAVLAAACPATDRTPYPTFTGTPLPTVCDPADASPEADNPSFTVDDVPDGAYSTSPFNIHGESILNESLFRARVVDAAGVVLNEIPLWIVSTVERYLDYEAVIGFDVDQPTPVCLQVYLLGSRADPTPRYLVQRNVLLLPGAETAGGSCPLNDVPPSSSNDPDVAVDSPADQLRVEPKDLPRTSSPVNVSGRARVFEGQLSLRLLAPGGREIATATAMASAGAPELGTFVTTIPFAVPRPTTACLQVYTHSPRDGAIENLVQREVLLLP